MAAIRISMTWMVRERRAVLIRLLASRCAQKAEDKVPVVPVFQARVGQRQVLSARLNLTAAVGLLQLVDFREREPAAQQARMEPAQMAARIGTMTRARQPAAVAAVRAAVQTEVRAARTGATAAITSVEPDTAHPFASKIRDAHHVQYPCNLHPTSVTRSLQPNTSIISSLGASPSSFFPGARATRRSCRAGSSPCDISHRPPQPAGS